jgi:predicted DNA-binding transcriptional regulator YafY
VTEATFKAHEKFSVQEFVLSWEEVANFPIVVTTTQAVAANMKRDLLFATFNQRELDEEVVEVSLDGFSLDWSASWLLGYGTSIQIQSPDSLRTRIRELALELAEHCGR